MAQALEPKEVEGTCCDKPTTRMVTYDCGDNSEQTLLVCDDHWQDECFSRFAKVVVVLKK